MSGDTDSVVRPFVRPTVKAIIVLLGLLFVRILIPVLPGLGNTVPSTELTVAQVLSAVVGLLMIGVLAWVGLRVHSVGRESNIPVVQRAARGIRLVVLFLTVLLLHAVLRPIVAPFLTPRPGVWPFDLVFLLLSLVPLGLLAYRVVSSLDAITDSIVDSIGDPLESQDDGGGKTSTDGGDNANDSTTTCGNCGTDVPSDGTFCPACGAQF